IGRVLAGGLDESSRSQRFAPGEVFLKGDVVPIGRLERNERAIVVAMANACIGANARGQLSRGTEATARDGSVHHAAWEDERALIQRRPGAPDALRDQVALAEAFFEHHSCGAA